MDRNIDKRSTALPSRVPQKLNNDLANFGSLTQK